MSSPPFSVFCVGFRSYASVTYRCCRSFFSGFLKVSCRKVLRYISCKFCHVFFWTVSKQARSTSSSSTFAAVSYNAFDNAILQGDCCSVTRRRVFTRCCFLFSRTLGAFAIISRWTRGLTDSVDWKLTVKSALIDDDNALVWSLLSCVGRLSRMTAYFSRMLPCYRQ